MPCVMVWYRAVSETKVHAGGAKKTNQKAEPSQPYAMLNAMPRIPQGTSHTPTHSRTDLEEGKGKGNDMQKHRKKEEKYKRPKRTPRNAHPACNRYFQHVVFSTLPSSPFRLKLLRPPFSTHPPFLQHVPLPKIQRILEKRRAFSFPSPRHNSTSSPLQNHYVPAQWPSRCRSNAVSTYILPYHLLRSFTLFVEDTALNIG
ncbi:hypothetical protein N656DRAFT_456476 [Canariomyces notabilis]|uniref:Uncharacterized protein n=1 Tax=Canariomyces notabilis TaxID=2074819 RepID=A0AAN6QIB2_9PEZI|nr:hypothetical protein N656DRAFT_456476 [Canariomyces arenarius]